MRRGQWRSISQDLVSLALGAFILIHEELTGSANTALLIVALVLLGSPAAMALARLMENGPSRKDDGDNESKPPSSRRPPSPPL